MKNTVKVFIIEDDKDVCESIKTALNKYPHIETMCAADGIDGVSIFFADDLRTTAPEQKILIVDYKMPHMNGVEVIKSIRKNNFDGPIIFSTGAIDCLEAERLKRDSQVYYLPKPYKMESLCRLINSLVNHEKDLVA
jgi:CheY-like chemotaxis protein